MTLIVTSVIFLLVGAQYSTSQMADNSSTSPSPVQPTPSPSPSTPPTPSSPGAPTMGLSKLSGPTKDFGLRFLGQINSANEHKNILFSPLSAILAYGMLLEGAIGQTEQQIKETLRLTSIGNETSEVAQASKKLLVGYKSNEDGSSSRNFSLAIGNLAMVNKEARLKPAYSQSLLTNYFAQVTNEDFEDGTAVMNKLNSWISEKTFDKIIKILNKPPERGTALILANTVYFKGQWVDSFPETGTNFKSFYNSDGTLSNIKMMYLRDKEFNYAHNRAKKVKIVELPYNGNVSMIFIMPTENNTINSLTSTLSPSDLDGLLTSMTSTSLRSLGIPKFELEDTHNLHEILPKMGMNLPFSDLAQFPNIAEAARLKVSQSIQKALIEVDEEGTVAAAATIIQFGFVTSFRPPEPLEEFVADRPFIFMIRDNLTQVNLFMGQMNKMPNVETSSTPSPTPFNNRTAN